MIPSVLPKEGEYTRALSLSRLAYDLEALVSPMLAAALLAVMSFHNLFAGTVLGFLVSAALVVSTRLPRVSVPEEQPFRERLTHGVRVFAHRSELRGLMGLNLVVAAVSSMVIVNTVVLVQNDLSRSQTDVALLLAAYGGGSMAVALGMPALLDRVPDRLVMLAAGVALPVLLLIVSVVIGWLDATVRWGALFVLWVLLGATTSGILTPSARLLRRNSSEEDRPAVFAVQFSVSHACFLVAYPVAGALGGAIGLQAVAVVLVVLGAVGTVAALMSWA